MYLTELLDVLLLTLLRNMRRNNRAKICVAFPARRFRKIRTAEGLLALCGAQEFNPGQHLTQTCHMFRVAARGFASAASLRESLKTAGCSAVEGESRPTWRVLTHASPFSGRLGEGNGRLVRSQHQRVCGEACSSQRRPPKAGRSSGATCRRRQAIRESDYRRNWRTARSGADSLQRLELQGQMYRLLATTIVYFEFFFFFFTLKSVALQGRP